MKKQTLIFLVLLWIVMALPPGVLARVYTLSGNNPGEPFFCWGSKITVSVESQSPPVLREGNPTREEGELPSPPGRIIYDGTCPGGPITFNASEDDVLTITFSSLVFFPIVKHGRVITSDRISISALTLCSGNRCAKIVPSLRLNAPFYQNFFVLSSPIRDLFSLELWKLSSDPRRLTENLLAGPSPYIDDSLAVEITHEDFSLALKAVDGVADDFPVAFYAPAGSDAVFTITNLVGDEGRTNPLSLCTDDYCLVMSLSPFTLGKFDDKADPSTYMKVFALHLAPGVDLSSHVHFFGDPEDGLYASVERDLEGVFVRGDDVYLGYDGWKKTPTGISLEEGEYPLDRIEDSLRFLAAGTHRIRVYGSDHLFADYDFTIRDSYGAEPEEGDLNGPDPSEILDDILEKLVSLPAEEFVIANTIPGRKVKDFNLFIGDPGSQGHRILRRWCEVYEPQMFEWVKQRYRSFFYFAYRNREILDATGVVLLRCYEEVERENDNETETFVRIIFPPEDLEVEFTLAGRERDVSFKAFNRTPLSEGTVALWFSEEFNLPEPETFETGVRIIVKESTVHSVSISGRRIDLKPSPFVLHGIGSDRGFTVRRTYTESSFAALELDVAVEADGTIPPDVDLYAMIRKVQGTGEDGGSAETALGDSRNTVILYKLRRSGNEWRDRIVVSRDSDEEAYLLLRFLALDSRGILYPGTFVNRDFILKIPDPFQKAILTLSVPGRVSLGKRFTASVYVDILRSEKFPYFRLKMGFFKPNRGWTWVREIIEGKPEVSFEEAPLDFDIYRNTALSIDVPLPGNFLSFTATGLYLVYVELLDGLTEEVLDNTIATTKIEP